MAPEYIIGLTAVVIGGVALLIPIAGLTARFALKPIIEAITTYRGAQLGEERAALMEQRVALLEEQVHAMEREQQRLVEESDFRRKLESPLPRALPSD
jgi:hypothetical protein